MTISPKVKLIFLNGQKRKIELYNRPPTLTIKDVEFKDGTKRDVHFVRWGVDDYREKIMPDGGG